MSDFAATTTTGDIQYTIQTYFDKVLLETLDPMLRFYQFADKKTVPEGGGSSVRWNIVNKFDMGRILTEGQAATISAGRNLSTTRVSAIVNQYGDWCPVSDIADITSMMNVGKAAVERLAAQAALTMDRVIANGIINHVSATGHMLHNFFKTSTEVTEYWGIDKVVPVIWQHITRKFSLINGETLRQSAMATLKKAMCHLQRLNERTTLWVDATVRSA